jgi:hypothetical protein
MTKSDLFWALNDMDERLIQEANEPQNAKASNRTKRYLRPVWLVAAVLILCTAAAAATSRLWSTGMASLFGGDETAQKTLTENGMTSLIYGAPVQLDNGLTITLEQVLCDGATTTLALRFDAPETGWITQENQTYATAFLGASLTIGDEAFNLTTWGFELDSASETSAFLNLSFGGDCGALDGQTAVLTMKPNTAKMLAVCEDMPDEAEAIQNDPLLLSEEVSFSWTLEMSEAICKRLEGSFSGEYEGMTITVEDVTLTPVSITFITTEGADLREKLYVHGFILEDGTEIGLSDGGYNYFGFDTVVEDLDSITGIAFASFAEAPVAWEDATTVFVLSLK